MMSVLQCRICGSREYDSYEVKEMMFGTGETFPYFECLKCGCLQIAELPQDQSRYYSKEYYSFHDAPPVRGLAAGGIFRFFKRRRNEYVLFGNDLIGRMLQVFYPLDLHLPGINDQLVLSRDTRILDVGCGNGRSFLCVLKEAGMRCLEGADPYLEHDIEYPNGLKILKKMISQLDGVFDLITFHSSFEHVQDPLETLAHARRLLAQGGICMLRMPTVSSYAWRHYREHWMNLDAPRHLHIHSTESVKLLAEKAGFDFAQVHCVSDSSQIWGSEQYAQGIPLTAGNSYWQGRGTSRFSARELACFEAMTKRLNATGQGDQAVFYLRKR